MRELANLAVLLGSLLLFALHVGLSFNLYLFAGSAFYFMLAGALSYLSLLAEWALRGRVGALPKALAAVEEVWWLLSLPTLSLSFGGILVEMGGVRALLWMPEYAIFLSLMGGASLGFRLWGASEGRRHAPRFLWQDSHPSGGVVDHIAFRLHALLGGVAAAIAFAAILFVVSYALRIPIYAQGWNAVFIGSVAFFSTLLFRLEHLERSALTEEAVCNNDLLHDRVEALVGYEEMKEILLEEGEGVRLAVVADKWGGRRAFTVHDGKGFEEACRRRRLPLVKAYA